MAELGENGQELEQSMADLLAHCCYFLSIGQYLQPSISHLPVHRFISSDEFDQFQERALKMGFKGVACGPMVSSSYNAGHIYKYFQEKKRQQ